MRFVVLNKSKVKPCKKAVLIEVSEDFAETDNNFERLWVIDIRSLNGLLKLLKEYQFIIIEKSEYREIDYQIRLGD